MQVSILDEALRPSVRELLITTSRGSQWQVTEGRDGTLVIAAGMPIEVEPYSFGVVILRQVEGKWDGLAGTGKEVTGG